MKNETLKPTKELLILAKQKAKMFKPNQSNRMQMLRLTAEDKSFTLFYQIGMTYIGSLKEDNLGNFFKNKPTYELTDDSTLKVIATMQRL